MDFDKKSIAIKIFNSVIAGMGGGQDGIGPKNLLKRLRFELEDGFAEVEEAIQFIDGEIKQANQLSAVFQKLARSIREWDSVVAADWVAETESLTEERRNLIYELLKLANDFRTILDREIPIAAKYEQAVLIAKDHQQWYDSERRGRTGDFYWGNYKKYLHEKNSWDEDAVALLDDATNKIIGCLSDPERRDAYSTRGLVVGYVQSGKTANFTAVIAKAADAGYRLIIVLSGTLNSLRYQTQRRLDKELVGVEILVRDSEDGQPHEYQGDQDWKDFISYGDFPRSLGSFDWKRLTSSGSDYKKLGLGRDVLRFEKKFPDRPLIDPANLKEASARLIVIKKIPAVIDKLISDLKGLNISLNDVPALIIDDESDQASVNTVNPTKILKSSNAKAKERSQTNNSIVKLLALLPRVQYLGYTATPAANTLINPEDSADLFPRDFIELLPRPRGYMGASDFHDFDESLNPLDDNQIEKLGFKSKKKAFVRLISEGEEDISLSRAIDAYILTGAIKLFRASRDQMSVKISHHTMLVHRTIRTDAHEDDATLVRNLYEQNKYGKPSSWKKLWRLWEEDFEKVSIAQEPDLLRPNNYEELEPFIKCAIEKIESSNKLVLVVNGKDNNKDDMPDFDKESVWNILVGGAKLSRGYTVEGLTITYFLRKVATADTLMQMGRWFGYRKGYRDLVRLYIGQKVKTGKEKFVDLYEMFESICRDEERFRKRILKYSAGNLKPINVPPLVPMDMLLPTAKNKMYNASIVMENYGGDVAESGRVTFDSGERKGNVEGLKKLLSGQSLEELMATGAKSGEKLKLGGSYFSVKPLSMLAFLEGYKWGVDRKRFEPVLGFLKGLGEESPCIDEWLVMIASTQSKNIQWEFNNQKFGVFERSIVNDRFRVFSEPAHRTIAKHIATVEELSEPNEQLAKLTRKSTAVCIIYPTIERESKIKPKDYIVTDGDINLGLCLVFPNNKIPRGINWRVERSNVDDPYVEM